ncbi:MAG: VanZ like family protein [Actinobacteria bacterium ADurb.BinA094]|nr:MAG: VanZ like family protein [Actinobacteria bacterium ADurb.BinA094]
MAVAALLFPLGIELAQLAVSLALGYPYRVTEIDDVLLNFVGVLLGFAGHLAARRFVTESRAGVGGPADR